MKKLLIVLIILLAACQTGPPSGHYDELAQCLTDKGITMYGTFWCPHCAKIKKSFGDSFQHMNYVECDPRGENPQTDRCMELYIEKYATFINAEGERRCCEPKPEELAEWAGCEVPDAY
ncbi:MAG: hypothetical protein ACE5FT_01385 [Candidatus Nanoarchaeia archaeon]